MALAVVVESEVNILQDQGGRTAQLVLPDQSRTVDANSPLFKNPARDIVVIPFTVDGYSGDEYPAIGAATQIQGRFINAQESQLELRTRDRPPGQDRLNARERERRSPVGIGDAHIQQGQIRVDTLPTRFDPPDADGLPKLLTGETLNVDAIVFNMGQNAIAQ